jgi:hypothetical protein
MTKNRDLGTGGKAAIVGAIGSAAIAAAMLYADRRKKREKRKRFETPFGVPPETD